MSFALALDAVTEAVEALTPPDTAPVTYFRVDDEREVDLGSATTDRAFYFGTPMRVEEIDFGTKARAEYEVPMYVYLHGAGRSKLEQATRPAAEGAPIVRAIENKYPLPTGVQALFADDFEVLPVLEGEDGEQFIGSIMQVNLRLHVLE